MRRKLGLALVAGAVAATMAPAAPARADVICEIDHPAAQVVCVAYRYAGGLVCQLVEGPCTLIGP